MLLASLFLSLIAGQTGPKSTIRHVTDPGDNRFLLAGQRVDFAVKGIPARGILDNIAAQASLKVAVAGKVDLKPLTASFLNAPLDHVLYQLYPQVEGEPTVRIARPYLVLDEPSVPKLETITFTLHDSPVRETLRQWGNQAHVSYTVAADVDGPVSISVGNRPALQTLREILKQVDAYFTIDEGILHILHVGSSPQLGMTIKHFKVEKVSCFEALGDLARLAGIAIEATPDFKMQRRTSVLADDQTLGTILGEVIGPDFVAESRGWRVFIRKKD